MSVPDRPTVATVALALVTLLSWGEHAAACSCAGPQQERLTLEISSVTVDGASTSVAPYQDMQLEVTAGYSNSVLLRDPRLASGSATYATH